MWKQNLHPHEEFEIKFFAIVSAAETKATSLKNSSHKIQL
jgi:hypothetical protein